MGDDGGRRRSGGFWKVVSLGCGVLLVSAIVCGVIVALNLDRIKETEWYREVSRGIETASVESEQMLRLRDELLDDYPAEISLQVNGGIDAEAADRRLVVAFTNPRFEIPDEALGRGAKAREIALVVAARYAGIDRIGVVRIDFVKSAGGTFKISTTGGYPFFVADLLAEDPAPPTSTR